VNIEGGRYWDRTSDLFGVNKDAAPALTCAYALTCGNGKQYDVVRCGSTQFSTVRHGPVLPVCSPLIKDEAVIMSPPVGPPVEA
jgi:hypothetical protein